MMSGIQRAVVSERLPPSSRVNLLRSECHPSVAATVFSARSVPVASTHGPIIQAASDGVSRRRTISVIEVPVDAGSLIGAIIRGVESVARSEGFAADIAPLGAGGVVSRPRLSERLGVARVTVLSASAGSGKTVLLRSWIEDGGAADGAGWVRVGRGEGDPQRFWVSTLTALRHTTAGSVLVQPLSPAPDLNGWAIVEQLLSDLASLDDWVWLVVDDVHELGPEALRQLELLIMRAPPLLRFVLATRHDVRLGLHRLRLEGELVEVRDRDLRFSLVEAEELFAAAGVEPLGLAALVQRTEGWAAGLRLAALSLVGHPEPARFAERFSGTERTVAEYLLAEVLNRQSEPVRRMLLRTSILDSVNGELADLLTGESGGERILEDLEAANAFVVAVDGHRSWFRYHHLFADLLQLELRRTEPGEVTRLHQQAGDWFASHGNPVQAIRQAQAASDWDRAARMLADHWPALYLDGQAATVHQLLAAFPAGMQMADAELAVLSAVDELGQGSLGAAERYLAVVERESASVATERQGQAQLLLGIARLLHARRRGDLSAVAEEARRLQAIADDSDATRPCLGENLRALALIHLGRAEHLALQIDESERHLEQGVALARRIGWPYLEFIGLAYQASNEFFRSVAGTLERGRQAVEVAQQHGWTDDPATGIASYTVGLVLALQGRLEEAETWVQRAERVLRAEADAAEALGVHFTRGLLELRRGRNVEALATFQVADRLAGRLAEPSLMVLPNRAMVVQTLVRLGQIELAEQALTDLSDQDRDNLVMRTSLAALRLAQHEPRQAMDALTPVLDGSAPRLSLGQTAPTLSEVVSWGCVFMLEAIAQDQLGDCRAATSALERALELAEPDEVLEIFLVNPAPSLLQRHAREHPARASLIAKALTVLAGRKPAPFAGPQQPEALSDSEIRVLRYLPTNLSAPEIANELYVSLNTVKTHMRHLYEKLGTHTRADTVSRGRALGLLAPSPHRR
jgi:LuxR family transcriptional regulator, maltose regulon positive regulatory protein